MDKRALFLLLVQTAALNEEISQQSRWFGGAPKWAAAVLANAADVPAEVLPGDVYRAAAEYVDFAYGLSQSRPFWLSKGRPGSMSSVVGRWWM